MGKIPLVVVVRVLAIVGQIWFIKLYAHYLTPSQLGHYFLWATISYFLNALIFVPFDFYQQAAIFKQNATGSTLNNLIKLNINMISIITIVCVFIGIIIFVTDKDLLFIFCIISISAMVLYASSALKSFLNNQGEQIFVVMILLIEILLKIGIFMGFVRLGYNKPESIMISASMAMLVIVLLAYPRVKKYRIPAHGVEKPINFREILKFCWPTSCSAILNWLQLQGYRLVMVPLGYAETVGVFATVSGVGSAGMGAASTVYQQVYQPRIYQSGGRYIRTYIKSAGGVIVLVLAVGLILRKEIVELATSIKFVEFAWVIGYGIIIEAGNLLIGALTVQLSLRGEMAEQVKAYIFGVVAIPIFFAILVMADELNIFTLGIPLVLSQAITVSILLFKSGLIHGKH